MTKKAVMNVALLWSVGLTVAASAQRPDFSGSWALDKNRSFSNPAGLDQTMTVVHKGDEIKVEANLVTQQGSRNVNEDFTLDGKEREFTPQGAAPNATGKRKAYWLSDNRRFVVNDEVTADGPNGKVITQITRKWNLSADGATLTVDYYIDRPGVSAESRRVFKKAK